MDALAALVLIVTALLVLDLGAVGWGADSRPSVGDDHTRS
jgi:hypothetical protein